MSSSPSVPPNVLSAVRERWPDRAEKWAQGVEVELRDLCARYDATLRQILPARYGFVVAVDTANGGLVMRSSPDPSGPTQALVAASLAVLGIAPRLHETITNDSGTWTVLDEVLPATPLADVERPLDSLDSLVGPLTAMKDQRAPVPDMPSIIGWLRSRLVADHLRDVAPGSRRVLSPVRRAAVLMLEQLAENTAPQLCHGDMSPWNILRQGDNGWMLIDPRGMSGEVSYDVAVLGMKIAGSRSPERVVARLARAVGIDRKRVQAWSIVAHAAQV